MSRPALSLERYRALDATGLAALLRSGAVTPTAVRELALEAVAAHPAARAAVLDISTPLPPAPLAPDTTPNMAFAGVPTFRKDLGAGEAGQPTTNGSAAGTPVVSRESAPYWRALASAGITSLGRSRSAEFGALLTIEPPGEAPVHNPHAAAYTAGGSSGGAAALVAAGAVPVAHANDAGGSIRIPAAYTGTIGYKPARAHPAAPAAPAAPAPLPRDLVAEFAITRSLRDTRVLARVLGTQAASTRHHATGVASARPRVGVDVSAWQGGTVHPDVLAATARAAARLEDAGYTLVPVALSAALDWDAFGTALLDTFAWLTARSLEEAVGPDWDAGYALLQPGTRLWATHGRALGNAELVAAEAAFADTTAALDLATAGLALLLTPATAQPARPLGDLDGARFTNARDFSAHMEQVTQYSTLFNVSGHAAIALPQGTTSAPEALPVGVQLVALAASEAELFDAAEHVIGADPLAPAPIPHTPSPAP
ncbi:amidase family protein [Leucobacter chromiireducens]|nr:amidase family protein [Leucobacter chromiireducens]